MAFEHLPPSKPAPRREKNQPIFCVGWRAFVHWPGQTLAPVPLNDSTGKPLANDLADGQEVEIVSWRPRSREGLLYQVRRVTDGSEWWIGAIHLRRQREAVPVAAVAVLAPR
ncbi:MAG TPA: hypothetical protein VL403_04230 [Candidatus Kryptonia bacterium]|nr:hypothetical protein [Candidatus Kryptonia bacterium]